nr:50S ribosomal protein L24 [Methanocella conradii]
MITSSQPRKQRKYRYTAPLHIKSKFLNAHLSDELSKEYGIKTLRVIEGDTVKVMRGDYAGTEGKVREVDVKHECVIVDGVSEVKADGKEVPRRLHASNLLITKLNTDDERRLGKHRKGGEKE